MLFLYFLLFICQYLYVNYIFDKKNPNVVKSIYKYTLLNNDCTATIYRTNRKAKKVIMFLSGGFQLGLDFYITKLMYDLDAEYETIMKNYELICYEKLDKTSFIIYDDVYNYILQIDKELGKIEELVLCGFSAGGVVASHIMAKCKDMTFKKKIITYDTPYQVKENVDYFKNNWVYRFDIIFFWKVFNVYSNHYNYNDIKHFLENKKWNSGSNEINKLIQDVHDCSDYDFYLMTSFNFDQTNDTKVYNIYSKNDLFVIRNLSDKFIENNTDKINFFIKDIKKDTTGHCSDMAFSTNYLSDIIIILFSN